MCITVLTDRIAGVSQLSGMKYAYLISNFPSNFPGNLSRNFPGNFCRDPGSFKIQLDILGYFRVHSIRRALNSCQAGTKIGKGEKTKDTDNFLMNLMGRGQERVNSMVNLLIMICDVRAKFRQGKVKIMIPRDSNKGHGSQQFFMSILI